jgi:predicted ATPase with chaperone activity
MNEGIMFTKSLTQIGERTIPQHITVRVESGIPGFSIPGINSTKVRTIRDRIRAAIISSRYDWPQKRLTVRLPFYIAVTSPGWDLAIAMGILSASGQISKRICQNTFFVGELGLDGRVRCSGEMTEILGYDNAVGDRIVVSSDCSLVDQLGYTPNDLVRVPNLKSSVSILETLAACSWQTRQNEFASSAAPFQEMAEYCDWDD